LKGEGKVKEEGMLVKEKGQNKQESCRNVEILLGSYVFPIISKTSEKRGGKREEKRGENPSRFGRLLLDSSGGVTD